MTGKRPVRTCQNVLEGCFDVRCVQCGRFNERQAVFSGEVLRFFSRNCPQVLQIALISNQHDHNVGIGMITQFLQPPLDVDVCCMLGDIVYEQCSHCTPVVADQAIPRETPISATDCVTNRGGNVAFHSRRRDSSIPLLTGFWLGGKEVSLCLCERGHKSLGLTCVPYLRFHGLPINVD